MVFHYATNFRVAHGNTYLLCISRKRQFERLVLKVDTRYRTKPTMS